MAHTRPLSGFRRRLAWCRRPPLWLLGVLLVGVAPQLPAADAGATEAQIKRLQGEINRFQQRLDAATGEQQRQQQQLQQLEVDAGRVSRQLDRIGTQRQQLRGEIETLKQRQADLQQARQQQSAALGEQLALAFRSGQQDRLKLLLNQEQPERLARLLRYHGYFSEARVAALAQFNQTLAQLSEVDAALAARATELAAQQRDLSQRQQELEPLRSSRRQVVAELAREVQDQSRQLAQLEADRKRLQRVLDQLQQVLAKSDLALTTQRFGQLKGRLPWPTPGRVAQAFGNRSNGVQADGILIRAVGGAPVAAVHNGRVVYSDWLRGYGLVLILDHGDGYMTLYGHNQSLLKEVGDWVAAGEPLARVGDSGGQAHTGLYFAIRRNGKPQNPQPWLSRNRG